MPLEKVARRKNTREPTCDDVSCSSAFCSLAPASLLALDRDATSASRFFNDCGVRVQGQGGCHAHSFGRRRIDRLPDAHAQSHTLCCWGPSKNGWSLVVYPYKSTGSHPSAAAATYRQLQPLDYSTFKHRVQLPQRALGAIGQIVYPGDAIAHTWTQTERSEGGSHIQPPATARLRCTFLLFTAGRGWSKGGMAHPYGCIHPAKHTPCTHLPQVVHTPCTHLPQVVHRALLR